MPKREPDVRLPGPPLTPAVDLVREEAYQDAYWHLVADRLLRAREALVAIHGDTYSQLRVAERVGKTQGFVSNLERRHRRIDTSALLVLSAVYGVTPESLVRPPSGPQEEQAFARWLAYYRDARRAQEPEPAPPARPRPRR